LLPDGAAMVLPGAASSAPARSPMAVLTPAVLVVYLELPHGFHDS